PVLEGISAAWSAGLVPVTLGAVSTGPPPPPPPPPPPAVVKVKVRSAAGWSGGSAVSVSLICAATTPTVHVVPTGSALEGWSVIEAPGEPLTVSGCGFPAGHCSVNAFAPALTGSLKPIVMSLPAPTLPAPLTGLGGVTGGGASGGEA